MAGSLGSWPNPSTLGHDPWALRDTSLLCIGILAELFFCRWLLGQPIEEQVPTRINTAKFG